MMSTPPDLYIIIHYVCVFVDFDAIPIWIELKKKKKNFLVNEKRR